MAATSRRYREASFDRAAGVVWSREFLGHTTPSARANVASRFLLIAHPPLLLLRRGADFCNFQPGYCRNRYPWPWTVTMNLGLAGSSSSFCLSQEIWTSTVRVIGGAS